VTALHRKTATELAAMLRGREVSAIELLDELASRAERLGPGVNAVVATNLEAARAAAARADAALARGAEGALLGVPMTLKDTWETVGLPTTSGAPALAKHVPERNADAVQRLDDAGAVFWGKTNTPLYAGDFQTYNEVYGTTRNPWDPTRTPGGSSGGAAAAVAAGFTPLELGSDIGGSIRNPSHCCGVYGHKASYGLISTRGHVPPAPGTEAIVDLSVAGPLARCAEDLELGLSVLAGPRADEAHAWRVQLPAPRCARLSEFRVGVWLEEPAGPPSAREVTDLIAAAVDRVAAAGARVDAAARPAFDPAESHRVYLRLLYAVIGAGFPPEAIAGLEAALPGIPPEATTFEAQLVRGVAGSRLAWLRDDETRRGLRVRWRELFEQVDVVLCPILPVPAFPHDHTEPLTGRVIDVDGRPMAYADLLFWAGLVTVAGLPATAVPVGRTRGGLPVGMQVVAPYLEDRTSLAFARAIADVVGGFVAPPDYVD
jgi:amidase